jgi:hypothetical protein
MTDIRKKTNKIIDTFVEKAKKAPSMGCDIRCEIQKALELHVRELNTNRSIMDILIRNLWQSDERIFA